jgi:hypothetical protein
VNPEEQMSTCMRILRLFAYFICYAVIRSLLPLKPTGPVFMSSTLDIKFVP